MTESFETTLGERATITDGTRVPRTPVRLDVGDQVGRYVIVSRLGSGSMGMVYGAFDPKLGRRVALKLLHETSDRQRAHDRLLAEAQATARLAHPNVVSVHDVGEHGGRVFIAMEFVEGQTLTAFLEETRPHWRDVLRMFGDAGKGLAAAHGKGLVHRDFKPDNVMVDTSGRVRVMDFGLAMPADDPSSITGDGKEAEVAARKRMAGTPAYMAPEQFEGTVIGPQTDQFSFCVALFEALYGERPFAGTSAAEIARAVSVGERRPIPRSSVPASVGRVLSRGLSSNASDRYPSMQVLLADLRPTPRRRRALAWVVGATGLATIAGLLGLRMAEAHQQRQCDQEAAAVDAVWNDVRRGETSEAIFASKMSYAEPVARSVEDSLDDLSARWKRVRRSVCVARNVTESLQPSVAIRAEDCLARDLAKLDGMLERIGRSEPDVISRAGFAAATLEGPERCEHDAWLAHVPPPEVSLEALSESLARAQVSHELEVWADAEEHAMDLLAQARDAETPAFIASAQLILCGLHTHHGRYEEARSAGVEALTLGLKIGAFHTAYKAGWGLAVNEARARRDPAQALSWVRVSRAVLQRAGISPGAQQWATQSSTEAFVFLEARRYDDARAKLDHAIALQRSLSGEEHPRTLELRAFYGRIDTALGRYDQALSIYREVARAYEEQLGLASARVAAVRAEAAGVLTLQGNVVEAEAEQREVLRLCEEVEGRDSDVVGRALLTLSTVLVEAGKAEEAERVLRRAVSIFAQHRPEDDPGLARANAQLGITLLRQGQYEGARALLEPAVARLRAAGDGGDVDVAGAMAALGFVALAEGDQERAREILQRASVAVFALHRTNPALATRLELGLAELAMQLDDPAQALSHFEAAEILIVGRDRGFDLASARWGIATALQSLRRQPERAQRARDGALLAIVGDDSAAAVQLRETIEASNASAEPGNTDSPRR